MKQTLTTLGFVLLFLQSTLTAAELDRPNSSLVLSEQKLLNKKNVQRGKTPIIANAASSSTPLLEHQLDKRNLLRCWQDGQLIVAENGYQSPGPAGQIILTKSGERMTGFEFGDTFCLYLGS